MRISDWSSDVCSSDLFVFRVPSLRNVAITAPYFHDGSVAQLDDAVRKMGEIQLGESRTDEEAGLIVQFLRSLNGEYNGRPIVSEDGASDDAYDPGTCDPTRTRAGALDAPFGAAKLERTGSPRARGVISRRGSKK